MGDLVTGAAVGAAFGELLKMVLKAIRSCCYFRDILARVFVTLVSLDPVIQKMQQQNIELGRPEEELQPLVSIMKKGEQLVRKCSGIKEYNIAGRIVYEIQLQKLINSLEKFITIDMQVQSFRDQKETQLLVKKLISMVEKLGCVKVEENTTASLSSHDSTTPATANSVSAKPNMEEQLEHLFHRYGLDVSFTNPFAADDSMTSPAKILQSSSKGNESVVTQEKKEVMIEGTLSVTVISAENLPALDFWGKSDPYVVLTLKKEKSQTKVEQQTRVVESKLYPVWNQTFDFYVEDGLHDVLEVEVWDKDKVRKDFIGSVKLSLTSVILNGECEEHLRLVGPESSYLNLLLKWMHRPIYCDPNFLLHDVEVKPVGILYVKLLQAEELPKNLIFPKPVVAVLNIKPLCDKNKISKLIENDSNPIWNERFEFTVEDVSTKHLIVEFYNSKKLRPSNLIGCAQIQLSELQPGEVKYVWSKLVKSLDSQKDNKNIGQVHVELLYYKDSFTNPFAPNYSMKSSAAEVLESSTNGIEANGNENSVTKWKKEVITRGVLVVTVISGKDLPAKDIWGKSDPFVVLTLRKAKSEAETKTQTRVVEKSLNPDWNEKFPFAVEDGLHDMVILDVWDKDLIGKDRMGRCILSLTKVILKGEYTESFELVGAKSGSLKLRVQWRP